MTMTMGSFAPWALGVLLVSVRVGVLFIAALPFSGIPVPAVPRFILIVTLAAGLVGAPATPIVGHDPVSLGASVFHEVIVGAAIAAGLFAAFSAFQFAGRLLDFQIGFGIAGLVDLATRNNAPLLGTLLSMLATIFFFSLDGHLALLRLLSLSLAKFPPGAGISALDLRALNAQFGTSFSFGMILVAPVVLCLFLVDIGLAFMSRTLPQMNVFVMSLALKSLLGLAMLAISIPFAGGVVHRIFAALFEGWSRVFG